MDGLIPVLEFSPCNFDPILLFFVVTHVSGQHSFSPLTLNFEVIARIRHQVNE
jgi:hypothetical protein